ncbi:hypothetical protein QLS71_000325 [Mariniflexile litorale]|uniref:LTXXQ motif family protein n=1 Tax=Mariniflexile litorale TaxID=3045158 RepID=A0AAU7EGS2_9FLAO|nr:hypothetical protein [Mariniflexile sp. KMM 9835]MDQ8212011.1 hypothetical protein [Mariniflexile sp. KMM 9835]
MKTFKNILSIAIILISINNLIAQGDTLSKEQKENIQVELEQYFEKLNLTEEQKTSYNQISKVHKEQLLLVKNSQMSQLEKLKEVKRIQSDKDAELKKLFSEEQYKIHQEFKEKQRNTMMENFLGYEKLNLTEDQEPQFAEITQRYRTQMQALKNSSKSKLGKYKEFKSIQNAKDSEMKNLLSKDQFKTYKEIQEEMKEKIMENRKK